jgi:BirA family biotin operon repressor/biotin-[acetyl-CoA-carboxylase] ligase
VNQARGLGGAPRNTENSAGAADRLERSVRRFQAAVSAEAQALAWANQEQAPHGAAVVVTHEVSPRGRIGGIWWAPAERTLACAVVLRPTLPAHEGDSVWLVGGLVAARAAESVAGCPLATWWPDLVIDAGTGEEVLAVKAQIQLGPGRVRHAVVTARFDLGRLDIDPARRDELLEALLTFVDEAGPELGDGAAAAAAYAKKCALLGERVKLTLLPKGETRGIARGIDGGARLEIESATGMVERIGVDSLRHLEVVPPH